jgi:hypothetical protein
MSMEMYPGRYPAIVDSYDGPTRTCRVKIPGITDGAEVMPVAEIEYPIGDRSKGQHQTEIEILKGDSVWVAFMGGDPRYPIITGWRNPSVGNSTEWRRFHHANIEMTADGVFRINADKFELNAKTSAVINSANATVNADTAINGGSLKHNGVNVGDSHTHKDVTPGKSPTGKPS